MLNNLTSNITWLKLKYALYRSRRNMWEKKEYYEKVFSKLKDVKYE